MTYRYGQPFSMQRAAHNVTHMALTIMQPLHQRAACVFMHKAKKKETYGNMSDHLMPWPPSRRSCLSPCASNGLSHVLCTLPPSEYCGPNLRWFPYWVREAVHNALCFATVTLYIWCVSLHPERKPCVWIQVGSMLRQNYILILSLVGLGCILR